MHSRTIKRPFWRYYGGKFRVAKRYPRPEHTHIIEPFAGAAGYACRYHDLDVTLYDANPVVAGIWDFLIHASRADITGLPDVVTMMDDVDAPPEAKALIGFWLNTGSAAPCRKPSAWMRTGVYANQFWGPQVRDVLAHQAEQIRHWNIVCGSYLDAPNTTATWFVDPPYQSPAGRMYPVNAVDFTALGAWVRDRQGLTVVCEQHGADWLPFEAFGDIKSRRGASKEVFYVQRNG